MKKTVLYLFAFAILSVILCEDYDYISTGVCRDGEYTDKDSCNKIKSTNETFECCYFEYKNSKDEDATKCYGVIKKDVKDAVSEYEDDSSAKKVSIKCESSIIKISFVVACLALLL